MAGEIASVGAETLRVTVRDAVRLALSVTVNTGLKAPAWVGVPLTTPADESESPLGRLPPVRLQV
ncbi:hypothetical protein ASE76_03530 [Xylophilus sp. Leaf220]|nr:hypothetical protein ASE76_03530 [Xylophilus sp. Leaf220]